MLRRQLTLHALTLLGILSACAIQRQFTDAAACQRLVSDAPSTGLMLQHCLDSLSPGATLALRPGPILLTEPLVLRHKVTLTTAEHAPNSPRCPDDGAGCAVLLLRMAGPGNNRLPAISVAGAGSMIHHLVIEGSRTSQAPGDTVACAGAGRVSRGGLDIAGSGVTITGSVVRDVACYSAVVVDDGAFGLRFTGNAVLSNGTHNRPAMWADGLTIIDGVNDVVRDNLFRDNTDVQLVLGGCLRCTVADNRLEETEAPGAGAFAGLLVHGWPGSSGDYAGTAITGNSIDCGPARRCGFGLGVGGRAWYVSATSGGVIAGNSVSRAQVGITVNDATGPMTMRDNHVTESGGVVRSHCGGWDIGAVNISAASRRFVDATAGVAIPAEDVTSRDFSGCIPGT